MSSSSRRQGPGVVYRTDPSYDDASRAEAVKCMCGEYMVFTLDALGRVRERCPRCRGVAPPRKLMPGEQRHVQTPVKVYVLPDVAEGQLRCQRCAHGVEGRARFCRGCSRSRLGNHVGKAHSPETRAKIGERVRAAWTPEQRLAQAERMRAILARRRPS